MAQELYPVYVLILLFLAYFLNQYDRYALPITTMAMAQDIHYGSKACLVADLATDAKCDSDTQLGCEANSKCKWDYDGRGIEYQLMVGPVFVVVYTLIGILLGHIADVSNRKNVLVVCLMFWSSVTYLMGFATEYWQLVLLRFGLGIGEAGCTPTATSIIADYFTEEKRGIALGVYNWGIYTGYSISYLGNLIIRADFNNQGWSWVYWFGGIPGVILGAVIYFTLREPQRRSGRAESEATVSQSQASNKPTHCTKLGAMIKPFLRPSLLLLCLAGSIRNGAGYVWGNNTQPYFNHYYPEIKLDQWFSWIPLVGGCFGVLFGGFISDRVVKKYGPHTRLWVLILSQLLAAPFAAATLYFKAPEAFLFQIPCYIFGEMWVSVTLAVVVELVPSAIRTSAVAVYLFIITNIGGNMVLLVPPLTDLTSFRTALYILYPGLYIIGSALFLVTFVVLSRDLRQIREMDDETDPLISKQPEPPPTQHGVHPTHLATASPPNYGTTISVNTDRFPSSLNQ